MEEGTSLDIFLPMGGLNAVHAGFGGRCVGFKWLAVVGIVVVVSRWCSVTFRA
jgi:hypothetical protein